MAKLKHKHSPPILSDTDRILLQASSHTSLFDHPVQVNQPQPGDTAFKPNILPMHDFSVPPGIYNEFYNAAQHHRTLPSDLIFVFGSNLAGRHGMGAAKTAHMSYGAVLGHGEGLMGRSYAIPTKDEYLRVMPLAHIVFYVRQFQSYIQRSDRCFFVTPVGCGLAGYKPYQIAPLFKGVQRCWLPDTWLPYIL